MTQGYHQFSLKLTGSKVNQLFVSLDLHSWIVRCYNWIKDTAWHQCRWWERRKKQELRQESWQPKDTIRHVAMMKKRKASWFLLLWFVHCLQQHKANCKAVKAVKTTINSPWCISLTYRKRTTSLIWNLQLSFWNDFSFSIYCNLLKEGESVYFYLYWEF